MIIINPSVELWGECPTEIGLAFRRIEKAGRICYKSGDKITDDSCVPFIHGIIKKEHLSVIEHSNLVVRVNQWGAGQGVPMKEEYYKYINCYDGTPYLKTIQSKTGLYVGGSFRAWLEYAHTKTHLPLLSLWENFPTACVRCVPNSTIIKQHIPPALKRITVKCTTSRAITHELVRHRPCSFLQESQRYVAYRDEVAFVLPVHYVKDYNQANLEIFINTLQNIENTYKLLLSSGERPEQARSILPNATAADIVITADVPEWKHIFKLRCAPGADPNMRYLMNLVKNEFENAGLISNL